MEETKATTDLEPLSASGKPPKQRIGSAALVNTILERLKRDDEPRAKKRALIDRQLAGNKPYNSDYLEKTNQADVSNVAFREAEGHVSARATTYFNLVFEPPCLVKVKIKGKYAKNMDRDYASIIASKLHDMLMNWQGFIHNILLHQQQMIVHAIGPVYWPNERDWRFKALRHGQFLVTTTADATLDTMSTIVVRGNYKAHELFWKIAATDEEMEHGVTDAMKAKIATEHGWNVELVKKLIIDAALGSTKDQSDPYQTSVWESVQQQIKNNDALFAASLNDDINVAHLWQREYRGKISWYIVSENSIHADEFLFNSENCISDFSEQICLFFSGIGDGSYHSVQGMGKKIFSHSAINDRLRNKMIDAAQLKSMMAVQGDMQDLRKIKMGRFAIIPRNVTIVANAFDPDIDGILKVVQSLENSLARNVGTDRPELNDHGVAEKAGSAFGDRIRLMREGRLERSEIMLYYLWLDNLYKEVVRRMFDEKLVETDPAYELVEEFKESCIDAGVPEALLKADAFSVKATRSVGFGSPAQSREIWDTVVSMSAQYPEVGKVRSVKRNLIALIGADEAEEIMPDDISAKDPSNQHSHAMMENSIMEDGKQVLVGRDQLHIAHLDVHFEPMEQVAQQFVSTGGIGDNPFKTHDFFMADLRHTAEHLDMIKDDPTRKPEYLQYVKRFDELVKIFSAIGAMVEKMKKAMDEQAQAEQAQTQGQPPAMDPEMQLKREKMMLDDQNAKAKLANQMQDKEVKTAHSIVTKNALTNQKLAINEQIARQQGR